MTFHQHEVLFGDFLESRTLYSYNPKPMPCVFHLLSPYRKQIWCGGLRGRETVVLRFSCSSCVERGTISMILVLSDVHQGTSGKSVWYCYSFPLGGVIMQQRLRAWGGRGAQRLGCPALLFKSDLVLTHNCQENFGTAPAQHYNFCALGLHRSN